MTLSGGKFSNLILPHRTCKLTDHSPYDENLIAAGCTDGRSYTWDLRMPNRVLYTLSHGKSLMPLQDGVSHERTDTGVRFLSWGQNARRLYSGSSDGVVKVWDVTQSQEDFYIKDLITTNSGIMSGAFTADYSKLVLGEVNGTANVLEAGRDDVAVKDADKFTYHPYEHGYDDYEDDENSADAMVIDPPPPEPTDIAATEARKWLETGQLRLVPMGGLPKQQVIQGPNYEGPFDRSEDAYTQSLREAAFEFQLNMAVLKAPQCRLPGCADNINTTTYEEVGDSGRSADRIPDEIRRQWLDETPRVVPGKSKCTICSRPALPALDEDLAFCERCSFTCFHCGVAAYTTQTISTLKCDYCEGVWDVGALGYESCQQSAASGSDLNVPALKRFGKDSYLERLEDEDTTFGDEMNALTDYYFGLAVDRPESPPL
jgi:ribosomal protein L37AE/L43A